MTTTALAGLSVMDATMRLSSSDFRTSVYDVRAGVAYRVN